MTSVPVPIPVGASLGGPRQPTSPTPLFSHHPPGVDSLASTASPIDVRTHPSARGSQGAAILTEAVAAVAEWRDTDVSSVRHRLRSDESAVGLATLLLIDALIAIRGKEEHEALCSLVAAEERCPHPETHLEAELGIAAGLVLVEFGRGALAFGPLDHVLDSTESNAVRRRAFTLLARAATQADDEAEADRCWGDAMDAARLESSTAIATVVFDRADATLTPCVGQLSGARRERRAAEALAAIEGCAITGSLASREYIAGRRSLLLARAHHLLNETDRARRAYEAVLLPSTGVVVDPTDLVPLAHLGLMELHSGGGDLRLALEHAAAGIASCVDHRFETILVRMLRTSAALHDRAGTVDDARRCDELRSTLEVARRRRRPDTAVLEAARHRHESLRGARAARTYGAFRLASNFFATATAPSLIEKA